MQPHFQGPPVPSLHDPLASQDSQDAYDPYNADRPLMLRCGCGADHAPQRHVAESVEAETLGRSFMEAALVKALFPQDSVRRAFLKGVGRRTAMAAIADRKSVV